MKRGGSTLMEVMAALAILMLAANVVILGVSAVSRMEMRRKAFAEAGERVKNGSGEIPAEFSLSLSGSGDSDLLTGDGFLYREDAGSVFVWSIWAELSAADGQEEEE